MTLSERTKAVEILNGIGLLLENKGLRVATILVKMDSPELIGFIVATGPLEEDGSVKGQGFSMNVNHRFKPDSNWKRTLKRWFRDNIRGLLKDMGWTIIRRRYTKKRHTKEREKVIQDWTVTITRPFGS